MFEERGFAETTVRDIAEAVGVTERTFFRYFPSKEDLVLGAVLDLFPEFARLVRARPVAERPYVAVRNALLDLAGTRTTGLALRASVLARASVAALRATVLAFHELPEEERRLETTRHLADQAFAILRDNPG